MVDGITITVTADEDVIPEGTRLSVEKVDILPDVKEAVEDERAEEVNVAVSYTFDIKLIKDETEIQPAEGKAVNVSFQIAEVADQNLKTEVYHIAEEDNTYTAEPLEVSEEGSSATVETTGFSYYTVEFTYNSLQYVLHGEKSVPLSAILDEVGLTGEVTAAEVSNESLFAVSKDTDEWIVTALQAFDSEEWLKVTINDVAYEIEVTDEMSEGDDSSEVIQLYKPIPRDAPEYYTYTFSGLNAQAVGNPWDFNGVPLGRYQGFYEYKLEVKSISGKAIVKVVLEIGYRYGECDPKRITAGPNGTIISVSGSSVTYENDDGVSSVRFGYQAHSGATVEGFQIKTATVYYDTKSAPESVTLEPSPAQSIDVDGKIAFTAAIEPAVETTDQRVKWSVSGEAVKLYKDEACTSEVGVDRTRLLTVYAKGMSIGSATVTVTSTAAPAKSSSCNVTVNEAVYPIWVSGTQVTSTNKNDVLADDEVNKGKVRFTPASGEIPATLNLNGATITTPGSQGGFISCTDNIELNIVFSGINTVGTKESSDSTSKNGIQSSGNINLSGSGSLDVYGFSSGISGENVTVSGGDVTAGGTGADGIGINSNNEIIISGGTVTAVGGIGDSGKAIQGLVVNSIAGSGWMNTAEEGDGQPIPKSETARQLNNFKKVQFSTPISFPLWVGDTQVTIENAANITGSEHPVASYDVQSNTLTLNGVKITQGYNNQYGIYYEGNDALNLVLFSTNTIEGSSIRWGINNKGINISGSGSLDISASEYGIVSYGDLAISSGTVTINSNSIGIHADNLIFDGGDVNVAGSFFGLWGPVTVNGGNITVVGTNGSFGSAIAGRLKNSISGTGWNTAEDTGEGEYIRRNATGRDLNYKKVQFPAVVEHYDLWVGGIQVTSANMGDVLANDEVNRGKVSFEPATDETPAKLELKGATITNNPSGSNKGSGIYYADNHALNIVLTNENRIDDVNNFANGIYGLPV